MCRARIVPSSGIVTCHSASTSSRNASNASSARSTSSMSSTGERSWVIASSSGRLSRNCSLKICASRSSSVDPAGLAQARAQHLPRIVPLVERRHRIEAFVALQPDQPRAQHLGEDLGALGLADAGRAFDEQRLLEREHDLQRGREGLVDDERALAEAGADGLRRPSWRRPRIVLRLLHEARAAVRAAEVIDDAVDLRRVAGGRHVDLHPAHRIDRASPARLRTARAPSAAGIACPARLQLNDFGEDRQRDLRRVRAPRSRPAGFRMVARPGTPRSSSSARTVAAALARRDQADVRRAALQARLERLLVVVPLRRDDDRAVRRAPSRGSPRARRACATFTPSAAASALDVALLARIDHARDAGSPCCAPAAPAHRRPASRRRRRGRAPGRTARRTRPPLLPMHRSSTRRHARRSTRRRRPRRVESTPVGRAVPAATRAPAAGRSRASTRRRRNLPCGRRRRRSRDRRGVPRPARAGQRPSPRRTTAPRAASAATRSKKSERI